MSQIKVLNQMKVFKGVNILKVLKSPLKWILHTQTVTKRVK